MCPVNVSTYQIVSTRFSVNLSSCVFDIKIKYLFIIIKFVIIHFTNCTKITLIFISYTEITLMDFKNFFLMTSTLLKKLVSLSLQIKQLEQSKLVFTLRAVIQGKTRRPRCYSVIVQKTRNDLTSLFQTSTNTSNVDKYCRHSRQNECVMSSVHFV